MVRTLSACMMLLALAAVPAAAQRHTLTASATVLAPVGTDALPHLAAGSPGGRFLEVAPPRETRHLVSVFASVAGEPAARSGAERMLVRGADGSARMVAVPAAARQGLPRSGRLDLRGLAESGGGRVEVTYVVAVDA